MTPYQQERSYVVAENRLQDYLHRIRTGHDRMRSQRVVVCGLTRNSAGILPLTIQRIRSLCSGFLDYRIVVYENDSIDATRPILVRWAERDSKVHLLLDERNDPVNRTTRCPQRGDRMALYRNRCREYVASNFSDFDSAIIVDMDLDGGWSLEGVANTFGHDDWDFVGSYGIITKRYFGENRTLHYDAWAFRSSGSDLPLTTREVNYLSWAKGDPLLPVNSCFGGLGVYRLDALLRCRYEGGDCEHVAFHRQMRENGMGRLFLNPSQMTFYGVKLSRFMRFLDARATQVNQWINAYKSSRARATA